MLFSLFTGMLIGLFLAAPIGPIDLLCIHRSLTYGIRAGFLTGFGAAFADVIYGGIAAFGMTEFTYLINQYRFGIQLIGGIILICFGIVIFRKKPIEYSDDVTNQSNWAAFLMTFFIVLTSPMTLISFVAAFTLLGVQFDELNVINATLLTVGVFLGSTLWWIILSSVVHLFKTKFIHVHLLWLNKLTGCLLFLFGISAIAFL